MSGLPYYKRYPRDFLEGTIGMSMDLKGAYSLLIDLIYIQRGKLPDDASYIAGNLGCSVRKWNSIRKELISRQKIKVENSIISNKRADKEEIILSKYQDKQAENRSKPNKNKDLQSPKPNQPEPEPKPENKNTISTSESVDGIKFDPRDVFNSGDFVFDPNRWFTENEIEILEDKHPKINVRGKISDKTFQDWAFRADLQNPLSPARKWFEKQEREEVANNSLIENYSTSRNMKIGDASHLLKTLGKRAIV